MGEDDYTDSFGLLTSCDPLADYNFDDFAADDDLCLDSDILHGLLEENSDPSQSYPEDPSPTNMSQGDYAPESIQFHSGFAFGDLLRLKREDSDDRAGSAVGSFEHHGKLEPSAQVCSPLQTSSLSFKEWCSFGQGTSYTERVGISLLEMPSCSPGSSFAETDDNHLLDCGDNLSFDLVDHRTGVQFKNTAEEFDNKTLLLRI